MKRRKHELKTTIGTRDFGFANDVANQICVLKEKIKDLKRWNETLKSISEEDKKTIDSLRRKNHILASNIPYPKIARR